MRDLSDDEYTVAANLCAVRNHGIGDDDESCPTCRADIVRLVDAPPSAPTGDGMPTVSAEALEWLRACKVVQTRVHQPKTFASEVLALLDWATRRQEQGNG